MLHVESNKKVSSYTGASHYSSKSNVTNIVIMDISAHLKAQTY